MRNYICGCFNTSPEVVCPEAVSHPEVRKGVIRGNLFKYFNIFIDAVWHVELCASCVRTAQASLHLSSLEKSHEVSINKADCPHVFFVSILFAGFDKSRSPWGSWEPVFLPFLLIGTGSTPWDYCERVALCLFPSLCLCLSSTPPSVSTTQSSSHTCTHFPQLVPAFSHWSFEKKAVQRSQKHCGFKYEVEN